MKYLKTFESSNYYYYITYDEREKLMGVNGVKIGSNKEDFTQQEKEELTNLLNSYNLSFVFDKPVLSGGKKHGLYITKIDDIWIIDKVKDEWFLVTHHKKGIIFCKSYKCDQFQGLLEFIKDEIYWRCINHIQKY